MVAALRRTDLASDPGAPGPGARLARAIEGEVRFDAVRPRPLQHRRLDLSDRAAGVVLPQLGRRRPGRARDRARGRRAGDRARRRHLAGRPDRRRWPRDRLLASISTGCSSSIRRRARSWVEPGVVLDRLNRLLKPHGLFFPVDISTGSPRDDRRHGRQQHLRRALAALRHHGRQRARDRRAARRRRAGAGFGEVPGNLEGVAGSPRYLQLIQEMRALAAARGGRRSRPASRASSAGSAATTSTASGRPATTWRACWSARRARSPLPPDQAPTAAAAGAPGARASAISRASTRRWRRPRRSSRSAPRRSSWSIARSSSSARAIPAFRPLIERFVRGAPEALLLVEFAGDEPGRAAREASPASGELMGDLGLPGRGGRGDRAGRPGAHLGGAHGRAQHRDVDEGRRQAGLVHRGLRGAARGSRRLHGAPDRRSSPATAPAAPGTRTPRSAACTSARSSI